MEGRRQTASREGHHSQRLISIESSSKKPWGLSDQKPSPNHHINVDTLTNLANNIRKFELKRKVRKSSTNKKNPSVLSGQAMNTPRQQSTFRQLVDDYKRRISMLATQEKKKRSHSLITTEVQNVIPIQYVEGLGEPEVNAKILKSITVKFGSERESREKGQTIKCPSLCLPIGLKVMSQLRSRILSRRQTARNIPSGKSESAHGTSPAKENSSRRPLEQYPGLININKISTEEIKDRPAKQMRIFDLEQFKNTTKVKNKGNSTNLGSIDRPTFASGGKKKRQPWMVDAQLRHYLLPR